MIDQKKSSRYREYIEAFYFAYREFTARPDRILEERGLNRVHHRILYFIGRHPGIGVSELLDILKVSKQALNVPLRQLIEMKLVERAQSEQDRRIKQLRLSDSGAELEQELTAVQMAHFEDAMKPFPERTGNHWLDIMRALK